MHIHIHSSGGEAKFWLEPQIELAKNSPKHWTFCEQNVKQFMSRP
ncbi:MAG: DUF4160 domain-containing protein [Deltaproteobacteria bacterium]|nr:DUF4160 domain-containing protein [Deltaproteobacteria bacterium]MBT4090650.1 DUF4160 domain-containing protein [Deltaproteobacteria bacterium]MBT4262881.1 DUF4160 domain-containing protein [Deltaproteobacteria bacterium]MBT4643875.1 DUF4160 domain-containing protein [Deltaproteobacteria bacterium]MBT6499242.1 DUF4160 domain-containing protein [Deltaproteobacteria bacterium]